MGRSVLPYDSQKRVSPEIIVSSKIYEPQPLVCPGVVTLYYDPEAPEKMYVEGDKSVLGAEALYAGIGVALLVLMFALL